MLRFISFLLWLALCVSPLLRSLWVQFYRQRDVSNGRWWFNAIWAFGGGIAIIAFWQIMGLWTEAMWYRELHQISVFWTNLWSGWKYFGIFFLTTFVFMVINTTNTYKFANDEERENNSWAPGVAIIGSFILSLIFAACMSQYWRNFLVYNNQVAFGKTDPIFGKDLGFYIFSLPIYELIRNYLIFMMLVTTAACAGLYALQGEPDRNEQWRLGAKITMRFISHMSILGVGWMGLFIFCTVIARWGIMYSTVGSVLGAGYTDIHARLIGFNIFIGALAVSAVLLLISFGHKRIKETVKLAIAGAGLCLLSWLIAMVIIPAICQAAIVRPTELSKEWPYLAHNIQFTRQAYGIDSEHMTATQYPVNGTVDESILTENSDTLDDVRLWDWSALQTDNVQRQGFRRYYKFYDTDVVRYNIDGKVTEMMYSGRELDQDKLDETAKTWQNEKLVYTHGYGGCMSRVNTFTQPEGLPDYCLGDIPVTWKYPELALRQPRIYYGELESDYVFVNSKTKELDYGLQDLNAHCFYKGSGGIPVGRGLKKLAFAMRYEDIPLLLSDQITSKSRIMFRRDIDSRMRELAPFLKYDKDPYQVIADGQLWYMRDAYTTSDHYPYSECYDDSSESDDNSDDSVDSDSLSGINYIRNSVKVVVNAYNGETRFYVFDDKDPIIRTYERIYPKLFLPAAMMPAGLRCHIRYPDGLIKVQGEMLNIYHMSNINLFYNKEDAWQIAHEYFHNDERQIEPYYITMVMPGEKKEELVQILPFSPKSKDDKEKKMNMVGWLAGRCDGANYGKLILYKFPKGKLVDGPMLTWSQVNSDEEMSAKLPLWNKGGSKVIVGNALVIPLSHWRLLSVQPIFIQGTKSGGMPELKRVVVSLAGTGRIACANTLEEGLEQIISGNCMQSTTTESGKKPKATPTVTAPSRFDKRLAQELKNHLERHQLLTGQGKYAEAGKEMDLLKKSIDQLVK